MRIILLMFLVVAKVSFAETHYYYYFDTVIYGSQELCESKMVTECPNVEAFKRLCKHKGLKFNGSYRCGNFCTFIGWDYWKWVWDARIECIEGQDY